MKRIYDYDGILADLRQRKPQQAIARDRDVSAQLVSKLAVRYGPGKDEVNALIGGRWVLDPVRRVQVWRAA